MALYFQRMAPVSRVPIASLQQDAPECGPDGARIAGFHVGSAIDAQAQMITSQLNIADLQIPLSYKNYRTVHRNI